MAAKKIDWESRIGRRLRLRDLHVFFTVVQCGSMAKAAAQLGVSQPTVSEVIAGLEHTFAVKLLDRSPQGVEATIYGEALLRRSAAAFDELKQSGRDIEFLADPTSGDLQIGCSEAFSATIVPPIIHRFSQAYPRVIVHVNAVQPPHDQSALLDRKNDLILARWVRPLRLNDLNIEVIFDDHLVVAAGMRSRWARRRKIALADLIDEPWVLGPPGTWSHTGTAEAFAAAGLDMPKFTLVTNSVPLRTYALANGPYISTVPRSLERLNAERHLLKVLPIALPVASRPVVITTLKNRTLSPLVERFIECARAEAKLIVGPTRRSRRE